MRTCSAISQTLYVVHRHHARSNLIHPINSNEPSRGSLRKGTSAYLQCGIYNLRFRGSCQVTWQEPKSRCSRIDTAQLRARPMTPVRQAWRLMCEIPDGGDEIEYGWFNEAGRVCPTRHEEHLDSPYPRTRYPGPCCVRRRVPFTRTGTIHECS